MNLKTIAEFINQNVPACKFVGLSNDGEVFVEFEHSNSEYMNDAKVQIQKAFPELTNVVAVVKPSIAQLTRMVEDLNALIEEVPKETSPENKTAPLLEIGEF